MDVVEVVLIGFSSFFEIGQAASRSRKAAAGIAAVIALQLERIEIC